MPKQGQSVESCIISSIKKKGDKVAKGDILFAYETDKASFEEEAPRDGVVLECWYNEGDEVPVLQNVMILGDAGEDYSALLAEMDAGAQGSGQTAPSASAASTTEIPAAGVTAPAPAAQASAPASPDQPGAVASQAGAASTSSVTASGGTVFISPRARKLAEKEALDFRQLSGSGPGGRIIESDVQAALQNRPKLSPLAKKTLHEQAAVVPEQAAVVPEQAAVVPEQGSGLAGTVLASDLKAPVNVVYGIDYQDKKLSNMRKLIAKSMYASLQNSAQLTHHLGADARRIMELRKQVKEAMDQGKLNVNITLNDMVCLAVIKALKKFPNVNSHFLGDSMRLFNKVHLGLAVDTERGLMVPALRNADDLSISGLASQLKELAAACRKGAIDPDLLSPEAASFTVSNLGNYGVEMFTPVINLPQSAILGVNTIVPRPKDLGGGVYAFVPYIGLSLTYDHRALDGGEATRFLKQIAVEIENLEFDIA
jgi:pyruvate dehydrogenase E2 component (dihydrolipoamide acetyltransferase)